MIDRVDPGLPGCRDPIQDEAGHAAGATSQVDDPLLLTDVGDL